MGSNRRKPGEWKDGEVCLVCGTTTHPYARAGHCWECLYKRNQEGVAKGQRKRKRLKRLGDGSMQVLCMRCDNWHDISKFVVNAQTHRVGWYCNDCRGAAAQDQRIKKVMYQRAKRRDPRRRQEIVEADKLYAAWVEETSKGGSRLIDISNYFDIVQGWVRDLIREYGTIELAAEVSGLPVRRIHSLKNGDQKRASAEVLEKLADHSGNDLEILIPTGMDGWSPNARACVECGTWFHPHYAHDRCGRCYQRYRRRGFKDDPGYWAPYYQLYSCRKCDRNDRKHQGKGLCPVCYSNEFMRRKAGKPSFLDEEPPQPQLEMMLE